jgi:nitrite reductase (NO-forming)
MVRSSGRRVWQATANVVVLVYLVASIAWLGVRHGALPGWLAVHLLLLGAVTNAIVTWTAHFASALLGRPQPSRRVSIIRLVALNVAIVMIVSGVEARQHAVVVAGVALLVVVVSAHGTALARTVHAARGRRFAPTVRYYYVAAAALVLGATAGAALAVGVTPRWQPRLFTVHVHLNLLGWVTLTVFGTQYTLWPTALRTRMVAGLESAARRCLPTCTVGLGLIVVGVLTAIRPVTLAGVLLYLAGTVLLLDPFLRTARQRPPHSPATWMLAAGMLWLVIALAVDAAAVVSTGDPQALAGHVESLVPWFLSGFVVQVLLGALTYLLPVVLGGPPAIGRRTATTLDRWAWPRIAMLNTGVLFLTMPSPAARKAGWTLCGLAVIAFVLLAVSASAIRYRADISRTRADGM